MSFWFEKAVFAIDAYAGGVELSKPGVHRLSADEPLVGSPMVTRTPEGFHHAHRATSEFQESVDAPRRATLAASGRGTPGFGSLTPPAYLPRAHAFAP